MFSRMPANRNAGRSEGTNAIPLDGVLQGGPPRWHLDQIDVATQQAGQCNSGLLQFSEVIEAARRERVRQPHGQIDIRFWACIVPCDGTEQGQALDTMRLQLSWWPRSNAMISLRVSVSACITIL